MVHVVADTLSFCHLEGSWGYWFGFLQFLPWFITPWTFLSLSSLEPIPADRRIMLRLHILAGWLLVILSMILQIRLRDPIPYPDCRDLFGTVFGLPSVGFAIVTYYATCVVVYLVHCHELTVLASLRLLLLVGLTFAGLYVNGLNTIGQLVLTLVGSALFALVLMLWIYSFFTPYIKHRLERDSSVLGWFF